MNYIDTLNDEVKEYFKILSPEFPEWLHDYINTPEMQRTGEISMSCGMDYAGTYGTRYWYSNLDHSIGVALVIWNFTKDKNATISGLFHDIATPVFKHCIDFMNGDSEHQESTEELTESIIKNSKEITDLLKRDNINVEDVIDYKLYPIADNDAPKLAADRFEYTFSSGMVLKRVWELDDIKEMYENISITKNEDGIDELSFKDKNVCEKYISIISNLWPEWVRKENRLAMQYIADVCKSLIIKKDITVQDLYKLSEAEVIEKIKNNSDPSIRESFEKFGKETTVFLTEEKSVNNYSINVPGKARYIDPLIQTENGAKRCSDISELCEEKIQQYLALKKKDEWINYPFQFVPCKEKRIDDDIER